MNSLEWIRQIEAGRYDDTLEKLYEKKDICSQRIRYVEAIKRFDDLFGSKRNIAIYSAPGRTEICGNHTDHNHGCVLAASVNLDALAVVSLSDTSRIRIESKGYSRDTVDLHDLSVQKNEKNKSASLIRGMSACFASKGYTIGGFDAYVTSNVLSGSGLSSSAAFEVLLGTILNHEFNNNQVDAVAIAQMAQTAENKYFGKPCGLMDQMASSIGGIISIDFQDFFYPQYKKILYDFSKSGYQLCIVDTGGNHADLTPEYASIPEEMKAVSSSMGVTCLRETTIHAVMNRIKELRFQQGDRAVLRALHFMKENERVAQEVAALETNDFDRFKALVIESGESSFKYLQNVSPPSDPQHQGLSLALFLAENILNNSGAWRVHGGGFAGTTQNFVPDSLLERFCGEMEKTFGKGHCHVLTIRQYGGVCVEQLHNECN